MIGASLSEPHTSMTALCTRVYTSIYACLDRPLISAFKYFTMIELQLSRENEREGLLPDCRVGVKQIESEDYSS